MTQGWIKLHRGLLEWEWYDHLPTKVLFLHLLLRANHKDNKYRGETIKKGCLVTSREVLSRETGLSERQIRTALTNLKKTNEVAIKSSRKGTEIQIVKYSEYQQETNVKTKERPRDDQQTTSNKNDNKEKNVIYFDNAEVNTTYLEFLQMRKEIKKPATETAIKKQIKMLNEFSDKIKLEIINKSIMNNYLGLFKPKGGDTKKDSQFFPNGKLRCI